MVDYTYSQLSQMQQEAAQRVREMRRRAKSAAEEAAKQFDVPQKENASDQQKQEIESQACPECRNPHCMKRQMRNNVHDVSPFSPKRGNPEDADRALLLSLCFLLQADKADEELILAMLYVLT